MIAIEDGVPVIAGRRFPWAWRVHDRPNECGARSFALMMENGWTVWVYFNEAGEVGAHAYTKLGEWRERVATGDPDDWQDIVLTTDECLAFIEDVARMESH